MYRLYCRAYQLALRAAACVLPWRRPELLEGMGSLGRLPARIAREGISNVLVVTDAGISALGLMDGFLRGLSEGGIRYSVYDKTVVNPTTANVEEALELYRAKGCGAIVAFGGGSPMDCAKGVGARLARPRRSLGKMRGILKVGRRMPPLFAIPTTAGTGSETTLVAVLTDPATHAKFTISDPALIPHCAVLDPALTMELPPHLTATTGMDALTHAVEAYLGGSNTRETRRMAERAVRMVVGNLQRAYRDGGNAEARANMLMASHCAGIAFTRAYVGNVHAIAHALGGLYGTPHGLANAVVLPHVLDRYAGAAHKRLAALADIAGVGVGMDGEAQKSEALISLIREMNRSMGIPERVDAIKPKDIPLLAARAAKEANPFYPVPRIFSKADFEAVLRAIAIREA